jgi:hypothetical protein
VQERHVVALGARREVLGGWWFGFMACFGGLRLVLAWRCGGGS